MKAHTDKFNIVGMAKILGVTPSGYYGYCNRRPSQRAIDDAKLLKYKIYFSYKQRNIRSLQDIPGIKKNW